MAAENRLRVESYQQKKHAGACNEEAADRSGIFFSGIRGTRNSPAHQLHARGTLQASLAEGTGAICETWALEAVVIAVPNDTDSQRRKLQSLGWITVSCIDILFLGFSSAT